jgi:hypothetical protein
VRSKESAMRQALFAVLVVATLAQIAAAARPRNPAF